MTWESFRVDAASLYLRADNPGTCIAELKMSFAGFGKPMFGQYGWHTVESNFNLEKLVLDELEASSRSAAESDLSRAISELPTSALAKESTRDLTERLERLADMHTKGLLTDEEFKQA
ncbi:MAG: hypothetical protein H7039_22615, partial [Bryobacteraceae bacterium]|nr:hypothetical protein [Bryobacteraceae bacterium]